MNELVALLGIIAAFAVLGTMMALHDVRAHEVLNRHLALAAGALMIGVGALAVVQQSWPTIAWALGGAALFLAIYAALALLAKGQLGSGDVWVAGLLGFTLGAADPGALSVGWAMPFALSALPSIALWLLKGRKTEIAFVPYLIFSAPLSILIASLL